MSLTNKRKSKPRQFPEDEGYKSERLVVIRNKRSRYINKLNKVINFITELINEHADIKEINKSNNNLETIICEIRQLTTEIIRLELDDQIKEEELNICTNSEFKLIQARNFIDSYIKSTIKSERAASESLPKALEKVQINTVKSHPHSEPINRSHNSFINPIYRSQSKSNSVHSKSSHSQSNHSHSSKSKSSKASYKTSSKHSSSHKAPSGVNSSTSSNEGDPLLTSYLPLDRRKTAEYNDFVTEQNKERTKRKLKILEKSFELQKEKLLEEAFEEESKAKLAYLEQQQLSKRESLFSGSSLSLSQSSQMSQASADSRKTKSIHRTVPQDSLEIYKTLRKSSTTKHSEMTNLEHTLLLHTTIITPKKAS